MNIGDIIIGKKKFFNGDLWIYVNEKYKIDKFYTGYVDGIKPNKSTHIIITTLSNKGQSYFTIDNIDIGYKWSDYFYTQDEFRLIKFNSL